MAPLPTRERGGAGRLSWPGHGAALALVVALLAACGPRFVPPTGVVAEPAFDADALRTRDGTRLPLHRWTPDGDPRAVVLGLHSFGDYGRAFEELGPWLADRGVLVVAYDQRGFGGSEPQGRWWGTEPMVADAVDAVALLRAAHPEVPLVVVGESMGGAVAILATRRGDGIDRLVLAAPAVRGDLPFRPIWDFGFATAATLAPGAGPTVDHARSSGLSPTARQRLRDDDGVVRRVRADTYWGLLRLANAASTVDAADLPPTLLLFGSADGTVPDRSLCAVAAALGPADAVRVYPDAGHRILHDRNAADAWPVIDAWLDGGAEAIPDDGSGAAFCAGV